MGLVFWEGVLILILVLTGFREAVFRAVPRQMRSAISVGIGLFIAFVGLINAGIVRPGGTPVQRRRRIPLRVARTDLRHWVDHDRDSPRAQGGRCDSPGNHVRNGSGVHCPGSRQGAGCKRRGRGWQSTVPQLQGSAIQMRRRSATIFQVKPVLGAASCAQFLCRRSLSIFSLMLADFLTPWAQWLLLARKGTFWTRTESAEVPFHLVVDYTGCDLRRSGRRFFKYRLR